MIFAVTFYMVFNCSFSYVCCFMFSHYICCLSFCFPFCFGYLLETFNSIFTSFPFFFNFSFNLFSVVAFIFQCFCLLFFSDLLFFPHFLIFFILFLQIFNILSPEKLQLLFPFLMFFALLIFFSFHVFFKCLNLYQCVFIFVSCQPFPLTYRFLVFLFSWCICLLSFIFSNVTEVHQFYFLLVIDKSEKLSSKCFIFIHFLSAQHWKSLCARLSLSLFLWFSSLFI